ncbi:LysR substrate-binding domain-containing protein [Labrys neptuniae]
MELRHLRYFIALAEELSFTAAAQRLHISQPPLSQQIRDLEHELGAVLFLRTSRKVMLTEAGTAFLAHARSIIASAELAAAQVKAIGQGMTGALNVAATGSMLLGPLAALMAEYQRRFPGVVIGLHEMAPEAQLNALSTRAVDISFLRMPPDVVDLVSETAWREPVGVFLPAGHRLAARSTIALAELAEDEHVFLRLRDSSFATYLNQCCVEAGFIPRISQQVIESYSLTSLVAAGFGIALAARSVSALSRPEVVYRDLEPPAPNADVSMVYQREPSPVLMRFLSFARRFLAQWRARPNQL